MNPTLLIPRFVAATALLAASLQAQQVVAYYDFENSDKTSSHTTPPTASDISLTNPHMFWYSAVEDDTYMCFGTEWLGGGSMSLTVTPAPGTTLDFTRFQWVSWKDRQSSPVTVNRATVIVDGITLTTIDPLLPIATNTIDLSGVPQLRNVARPITFEVDFFGAVDGRNWYEISSVSVEAAACVENIEMPGRSIWLSTATMDQRWRALDGSSFVERGDGTAQYLGAIENVMDPCKRFSVELDFGGRVDPGDPSYPPAGSPYTNAFVDANLVSVGGIIDTNTWRYYTTMTGTMTGRLCYEGASLAITRRGAAFQVGVGANVKTLDFGGSGWFDVAITSQSTTGCLVPSDMDRGDVNTAFGTMCVCIGGIEASWNNYGAGKAGCNGLPSLTMLADPLTGSFPQIQVGSIDPMTRAGALIWGIAPDQLFIPLLGGDLLVASPFAAVDSISIPPGGYVFDCEVVDDACLAGTEFYLQAVTLDPCATFALSRGLRIVIGDL